MLLYRAGMFLNDTGTNLRDSPQCIGDGVGGKPACKLTVLERRACLSTVCFVCGTHEALRVAVCPIKGLSLGYGFSIYSCTRWVASRKCLATTRSSHCLHHSRICTYNCLFEGFLATYRSTTNIHWYLRWYILGRPLTIMQAHNLSSRSL